VVVAVFVLFQPFVILNPGGLLFFILFGVASVKTTESNANKLDLTPVNTRTVIIALSTTTKRTRDSEMRVKFERSAALERRRLAAPKSSHKKATLKKPRPNGGARLTCPRRAVVVLVLRR
jgi:hypothetical protein